MKKILFVGAEAMPFAATGGLGDVLGSLPAAIAAADENVDIRVVMPLYAQVSHTWRAQMKQEAVFYVKLAWRNQYCGVFSLVKDGVTYYFLDNEYYFKRDTLYGQMDDGERYAFFCKAVLEMMRHLDYYPDILHAHDWQSAMSVVYLNTGYRYVEGYHTIRSAFTIHNIEYQGKYDFGILGDVFDLGYEYYSLMNYGGCINLMKAAIECADRVTTVSPRYAQEILSPEYAHGLHHCLRNHQGKLCGILNGIDYDYYNPKTDPVIAQHFSSASIYRKYANKVDLQRKTGLPESPDVPLLAIISRLATHKGLDLITEIAYNLMKEHDAQLVILGKGEKRYEDYFRWLESQFPDKVRALIQYDRDLSKRIYAACDVFLMPSHSEPCGLSQMIASRYGAIPVTRETGGLYDSIKGYWVDEEGEIRGNGFTFANYSSYELAERTGASLALYQDTKARRALIRKIMETDFSWNVSALCYLNLYRTI
ncbi:MAG: glycogen synthase GlgA [Ruminococcaceae bacterium]|nr:glycogen synthase GlgA [Oscillospiraceae bacterium]